MVFQIGHPGYVSGRGEPRSPERLGLGGGCRFRLSGRSFSCRQWFLRRRQPLAQWVHVSPKRSAKPSPFGPVRQSDGIRESRYDKGQGWNDRRRCGHHRQPDQHRDFSTRGRMWRRVAKCRVGEPEDQLPAGHRNLRCTRALALPVGISRYPITVSTTYQGCSSPPTPNTPVCSIVGGQPEIPPLPAGTYHTTVSYRAVTVGNTVKVVLTY